MSQFRRHWPFLLIVLAFLTLSGIVSVVNPLFESTDEIRHYRCVRHLVVPVQGAKAVRSHPQFIYLSATF